MTESVAIQGRIEELRMAVAHMQAKAAKLSTRWYCSLNCRVAAHRAPCRKQPRAS
jgi:hypothetical protein